jgi:ketosteroid isomerase-like protein
MSRENVETVRRYVAAAGSDRMEFDVLDDEALDLAMQVVHPEVEFHEDPKFPEASIYRGRDALRAYFKQFSGEFDRFLWEAEDLLDAGDDQVLVLIHVHGRGKGSGADFDTRAAWLFTMKEDRAVRVDAYLDRSDALEAAGLRE